MVKVEPVDVNTEDSMDGGPPSVCSSDMGAPSTPNSYSNHTVPTFKKVRRAFETTIKITNNKLLNFLFSLQRRGDGIKSKQVTGYILYSSGVRKTVTAENPNCTFGEISRIVGHEVRYSN